VSSDLAHNVETRSILRERDLYLRLLNLGRQTEIAPFLDGALGLIVDVTDARQGYLELYDDDYRGGEPRWSIARGFSADEVSAVRRAVSTGIIGEAIATGRAVTTASALDDDRFGSRQSVRRERIDAVLCVPIGEDPPRGVLYLQGRTAPGPFSARDQEHAEVFASHLAPLVDRVLEQHTVREASDPTRPWREKLRLNALVGRSDTFASVLKQVALVAPLDVGVLLTGESGTGKSQLARAIHDNSPRAPLPFVELNCAALPENLVESELFGALPGAHSTATRRMDGKVAAAACGTLFLDEIGELPVAAQAKLLQLLQSKQYYPLGATKPERADVRVIAATNTDLERAVAERRFREDLYFRLAVVPIRVPALAERREDIAGLGIYFCAGACERHGLPRLDLSRNALRALESAEWPGNVRQLAHAVEAAAIRCAGENARQVERRHVFPPPTSRPSDEPDALTLQDATRQFQAQFVRDTLEDSAWNVLEAARRLDIARSHLYRLMNAFGIEREAK
jgi:Nif-specific regulatory protein